jgi:hypothetical protein
VSEYDLTKLNSGLFELHFLEMKVPDPKYELSNLLEKSFRWDIIGTFFN